MNQCPTCKAAVAICLKCVDPDWKPLPPPKTIKPPPAILFILVEALGIIGHLIGERHHLQWAYQTVKSVFASPGP
ncbi:hypothetical protein F183_A27230 [Bryobacterales bacterium F-183]|nr:hypothetical protein F183_A27230 [Bryobacterales bacterium F-183]